MINSADEFVALRSSEKQEEYLRAAMEPAPIEVWQEVIDRFPEMKAWVSHNKTIPIEILESLARDPDARVRAFVAMKNKLSKPLFLLLAEDDDPSVRQRIAYNKNAPPDIALSSPRIPPISFPWNEFEPSKKKRTVAPRSPKPILETAANHPAPKVFRIGTDLEPGGKRSIEAK